MSRTTSRTVPATAADSLISGLVAGVAAGRASALSDEEAEHAVGCATAPQAAAEVLTARGFRTYASVGGAGTGGSESGWHAVLISPGTNSQPGGQPDSQPDGQVDVSTYVIAPSSQYEWDLPDLGAYRQASRRRSLTNMLTRISTDPMTSTTSSIERLADLPVEAAAVNLSVLVPAWWAERQAEGHTRKSATFLLNLLLSPEATQQVDFTARGGLPTMRGFTLLPHPG